MALVPFVNAQLPFGVSEHGEGVKLTVQLYVRTEQPVTGVLVLLVSTAKGLHPVIGFNVNNAAGGSVIQMLFVIILSPHGEHTVKIMS